ncbi:uncharacterized protein LOC119744286 [Patiria miniata]|uniref:G-protein coupled receptors family 2 profile 2 domain-containing protein n=1 Tax=Patiria miniata TaxID=46514 RepID=A0A914BJ00_PATMI|nr:uncharacterized protein LOC119744286 [Patiria miniata]
MARYRPGSTIAVLRLLLMSAVVHHLCCFVQPAASISIEDNCQFEMRHCAPNCGNDYSTDFITASRVNCYCDTNCVVYGDCCIDYSDHCANGSDPWANRYDFSPHMVCVSPYDPDNAIRYPAVGRCPLDWPMDDIRQNCENETLARSQRFLTLLVNGPDEIVFKNVYCAICHHVTDPVPWRLRLWDCELAEGETDPVLRVGKPKFDACEGIEATPPTSMLTNPHRCFQNFIDSCPETTNVTESQIALCGNYTSLQFHFDVTHDVTTAYKNVYCAYCNGASLQRTGPDALQCNFEGVRHINPFVSVQLLFDFTTHSVSTEKRVFFANVETEMIGKCSLQQQYDPFIGVCRNLTCPVGRMLQMGQCVESYDQIITQAPSGDCWQQLLSSLIGLDNISIHDLKGNVYGQASVYVDLSVAARIQGALDQLFSRNLAFPCNATTSLLLVASRPAMNASRGLVCEGFTQHNVDVNEIAYADGVFHVNISGFMYEETEFVHNTKYEITHETRSRNEYLILCDPFIGNDCPVLAFDRSEFLISGVGAEVVFVHKASGNSFDAGDVWQLPDGTLRMCNFLLGTHTVTYPAWLTTLSDVSFAGSVCSIVVLVLTFITYMRFSVLRNVPGKLVLNLIAALILAHVSLVVDTTSAPWLCVARALVLHFSWLAIFTWMSILAGNLAIRMRSMRPPSIQEGRGGHKVVKVCVLAWGLPAIFVAVCFLVSKLGRNHSSFGFEYGGSQCWIVDSIHALLVFGVPLFVLLFVNCLFLVAMIYAVISNRRRMTAARMATNGKTDILLCAKLVVLTGATWSLFLTANLIDVAIVWYLAVVVNSLHGALIGLTFLLKDNVRALWRQQWLMFCGCHCRCLFGRHTNEVQQQSAANSSSMEVVSGRGTSSTITGGSELEEGDLPYTGKANLSSIDTQL